MTSSSSSSSLSSSPSSLCYSSSSSFSFLPASSSPSSPSSAAFLSSSSSSSSSGANSSFPSSSSSSSFTADSVSRTDEMNTAAGGCEMDDDRMTSNGLNVWTKTCNAKAERLSCSRSSQDNSNTPQVARSIDTAMQPLYHSLKFSFDDFFYDEVLGTGIAGMCVCATERRTGVAVAIKILSKLRLTQNQNELSLLKEVELQSHLHHPHIVRLLTWFDDESRVAMVMEYCEKGDLFHFKSKMNVDERMTARWLFDVIWALRFCHANSIAHLDLKPENIMVDRSERLLLGDFGMSEHIHAHNYGLSKNRGTFDYWCPEQVVKGDKFGKFNHRADIWAIGVLAYETLCGSPPFGSTLEYNSQKDILKSIETDPWNARLSAHRRGKPTLSRVSSDFLSMCLRKHAWDRPTAEALLDHEFISRYNQDKLRDPGFVSQDYKRGTGFNAICHSK